MANTVPRQFRLNDETLADLDAIADHLAKTTHSKASRADAIRYAAREIASKLNSDRDLKKSKKSG